MGHWKRIYTDPVILLFAAAVVAVTVQHGILEHSGNFWRFRTTFQRLVSGADIYNPPPSEITGFLYSPTFALLFAPFAILPPALGLLLWNGVNALTLAWGLIRLLPPRRAQLALLIVFLDTVRSLQNSQSNALVAGLIILAFLALERERYGVGAAAILGGAFIKIYPFGAAALGLMRPRPGRFLILLFTLGLLGAALPLLVLPPPVFIATYHEWWSILHRDTVLQGQSAMRVLTVVLRSTVSNLPIQLVGALLLLAPLIGRRQQLADLQFRTRWLCSLLVFCVVFNHQAESSSFVVAATGVATWYVTGPRVWWRTTLVGLVLAFETLPHLFFMPPSLYSQTIGPNALDVVPCLLVWLVIQIELWRSSSSDEPDISSSQAVAQLG